MDAPITPRRIGIHWFRRDLRVSGNPALQWNLKKHDGCVVGLFCIDRKFLDRPDFSKNRFAFFLKSISALKSELKALGGDLLVIDADPVNGIEQLVSEIRSRLGDVEISVSYNRDYEPFARARDTRVTAHLKQIQVETHSERDHLIIEPHEILKDDGSFYQVYSAFARRWFATFASSEFQSRIAKTSEQTPSFRLAWQDLLTAPESRDVLSSWIQSNSPTIPLPDAGASAAHKRAEAMKGKMDLYKTDRDIPSLLGTSKLSIYLKNGSITSSTLCHLLLLEKCAFKSGDGKSTYLQELVWREFYYALLYHCPRVENEAFIEKYKAIQWQNDETLFELWKNGQTGYPIVDAGMRELSQTGWMHNRVRMIVASFLTKDLLIDWRWGERHFMVELLDGDLAPNNGGWQWAASTGCDAQPYFRIFNPHLQAERFDPGALYIKKFCPELSKVSAREIHSADADLTPYGYVPRCVEHAARKVKALSLFSNCLG